MGGEYFDLFYSHRFDPNTPLDETLAALDTAVRQGKALYTGISSYSSEQTQKSIEVSKNNGFSPIDSQCSANFSILKAFLIDFFSLVLGSIFHSS